MISLTTEPLLQMLVAVVKEARLLRTEFAVLDLPHADASFFHDELADIERRAARCIAICVGGSATNH